MVGKRIEKEGKSGISRKGKGQTEGKKQPESRREELGKEEGGEQRCPDLLVCLQISQEILIGLSHTCSSLGRFQMLLKRGKSPCFFQKTLHSQSLRVGASFPPLSLPHPEGKRATLSGSRQGRTQPVVLGNLRELIPDVVEFFLSHQVWKRVALSTYFEKESKQGHILCVARPT